MLVYWLVLSIGRVQAASCHTTFGVVLVLILASARTGLNSQACSRQVQSLTGRQLKQLLVPAACQCWLSICLMAFWHTTGTSEVYQKEENKLGFFWQCHCSFPGVAVYCPLPLVPFGCCGCFKPLPLKRKEEDKLLQNKISKLFLLGLQVCQVAKEYRLHWFAVRTVRKKKNIKTWTGLKICFLHLDEERKRYIHLELTSQVPVLTQHLPKQILWCSSVLWCTTGDHTSEVSI